ncbi:MAG: gamma-glutamyl-gamma-aminobutyrate hydrolase family protein [Atopobiaceae bacterium]|nr:gamma-glutamyl-gamma-aminobutyrate hydrolase family protein [Atopobiaceae bacterium]
MNRPLIGICARNDKAAGYTSIGQTYADRIAEAGGIPVALPLLADGPSMAQELVGRIDGLLLTGGADTGEQSFGGHPYETGSVAPLYAPCQLRDSFEEAMIAAAWNEDLPILGVCRGMQVLNAARGGTLIRDISELDGTRKLVHLMSEPFDEPYHHVSLNPASRLAQILDSSEIETNSLHHQAVATPAPGAHVVGHASDGVIEAIEFPELTYCIGVQWHPEYFSGRHPLFESFVEAAQTKHNMRNA